MAAASGFAAARARLKLLAAALRDHQGVIERAAGKVQRQIDAVSNRVTEAHRKSGDAAGERKVILAGGAVKLTEIRYMKFHGFNPFRKGMPGFVIKRAAKIFATELLLALGGNSRGQVIAAEALGEAGVAAAEKKAAKMKASAEKKVAREKSRQEKEAARAARPKTRGGR